METCSRAGIMSLWGLAIHPKDLFCLTFRVLPKLLGLPLSLLKKFRKDEHAHPPLMETAVGTLPELPQDILMDIFATLEIPDLVRSGSVCSSWRSAYTSLRNRGKYKQSQTPCLLYTSESAGENVVCLYSLVEKRSYKLTLPEPPIRSRFLIGSSLGWLVTVDEISQMHLVNPITGEQIALPSVNTIEQVKPIFNDSGAVDKYELSWYYGREVVRARSILCAPTELRDHLFYKAFVFPDASTGSYVVVLIHNPYSQLSFARSGDDKWTWLPPNTDYTDCIYMDGLLYALTSVGQIDAFDLAATTVTRKLVMHRVKHYISESMYIIRAPWGDLLQVWRIVDQDDDALEWGDEGGDAPEWEDEDGDALEWEDEDDDALEWEDEDDDDPEWEDEDDDALEWEDEDDDDPEWEDEDDDALEWEDEGGDASCDEDEHGDAPEWEDENGDAPEWEDEAGDASCDEDEHDEMLEFQTKKIRLYKVDMAAKELVKISSLPDHMLFLGHNQSLCLSGEEYPQLKANHVYFTDDNGERIMERKNNPRDVGVFDLENSRRKEIVSPQIWSNWPSPMWITPSLTTMNQALSK